MKTIEKTTRRVVIELTSEEIAKNGFEKLWDDIRAIYPAKNYELHSINEVIKGMVIEVELWPIANKPYSAST